MTDWRAHPQQFDAALWIMKPRVVFRARVNMLSAAYPLAQLTYDNAEGDWHDIEMGMTVFIGTAAGREDLGRTYARGDSVWNCATSTTIDIGYSSRGRRPGEVDLQDNAYITVLDLFEPWKRPSRAGTLEGSILKDYNIGTPQNWIPVIHCGNTGGLGNLDYVDPDTGTLELGFDASTSYLTSPTPFSDDWWSLVTFWDMKDGSYVYGGLYDEQVRATFPPGYRWIARYGATLDPNFGLPRRFCVVALEDEGENAPLATAYRIKWSRKDSGQTLTAMVRERLDPADYPVGTVVMLLVKSTYGGEAGPVEGCWQLQFAGYLNSFNSDARAAKEGNERTTTITAVDVLGRANQLRAFPSMMVQVATEQYANQMQEAHLAKYAWWTFVFHTSIPMLTDMYLDFAGSLPFRFSVWQSPGGTFYNVGNTLAKGYRRCLTMDSLGVLRFVADPQRLNLADRTSEVVVDLTAADWSQIKRQNRETPTKGVMRATYTPTSTTPAADITDPPQDFFVIAPGLVEGQGAGESGSGMTQLARNSPEARESIGHDYARENAVEDDLKLTLAHGGDVGIEPARKQWVTVTADAEDTGWLDRDLVATRCLPMQVDFDYNDDAGSLTQALVVERETIGTPGATEPRPARDAIRYTNPRTQPVLTPVPPNPVPDWSGAIPVSGWVLSMKQNRAQRADSFDPTLGTIAWTDISTGLSGAGRDGFSDPWDFARTYGLTTDGIYVEPDRANPTTFSQLRSTANLFGGSNVGHKARGSHLVEGWRGIIAGSNMFLRTTNDFSAVAVSNINGATADYASGDKMADFCICGHDAGHIIALAPSITHSLTWAALWVSEDDGATWALLNELVPTGINANYVGVGRQWIEVPYNRRDGTPNVNDADLELWWYAMGDVNTGQSGRMAVLGGAGSTVLEQQTFAAGDQGAIKTHPMTAFTHTSQYGFAVFRNDVEATDDGWNTTSGSLLNIAGIGFNGNVNGISTNPDCAFVWLTTSTPTQRIYLTFNRGADWFGSNPTGWDSDEGIAVGEFSLYDVS